MLIENDVEKQEKRALIIIFSNLFVQRSLFLYKTRICPIIQKMMLCV